MYLSNRNNILATEEHENMKRKTREYIRSLGISAFNLAAWPTCVTSFFLGKVPRQDDIFTMMETKENAAEDLEVTRHTAFQKACYDLTHSERVMNNRTVGRRVGLYELRGVIGSGNFSQVRFGIHDLTKGETNSPLCTIIAANPKDKHPLSQLWLPKLPLCLRLILFEINWLKANIIKCVLEMWQHICYSVEKTTLPTSTVMPKYNSRSTIVIFLK